MKEGSVEMELMGSRDQIAKLFTKPLLVCDSITTKVDHNEGWKKH